MINNENISQENQHIPDQYYDIITNSYYIISMSSTAKII